MIEVRPHEICVTEDSLNELSLPKSGWYTMSFDILRTETGYDIRGKKIIGHEQVEVPKAPRLTKMDYFHMYWQPALTVLVLLFVAHLMSRGGEIKVGRKHDTEGTGDQEG